MIQKNRISDRAKILLVDEDESIFYLLRRILQGENYRLYFAKSGKQGLEMCTSICPDLVLMDIRLSDMEGTKLIGKLREWMHNPIIVISERNDYADKVCSLYAGADDYVVKPFSEQELKARIYVALRRRVQRASKSLYQSGNLVIDFGKRQVTLLGEEVHLSPIEYRILECLALNAGTVVTYQMLLERIWGPYSSSGSRILRVNMTNIRKKIEQIPTEPAYIVTIPRVGYRMLEESLSEEPSFV